MRNRKINEILKGRLAKIPSMKVIYDSIDDIYTHHTTFVYYCKYTGSVRGLKKYIEPLDEYMEEMTKEHVKFKINTQVTCDELVMMGVLDEDEVEKNEKICDEFISVKFVFRNDVVEKLENMEIEEFEKKILKFKEYKKIQS